MFKNLQSGAQPATGVGDSKLRVDVSVFHYFRLNLSKPRNYFFHKQKRIFDGT
jgi:hypothetical protein